MQTKKKTRTSSSFFFKIFQTQMMNDNKQPLNENWFYFILHNLIFFNNFLVCQQNIFLKNKRISTEYIFYICQSFKNLHWQQQLFLLTNKIAFVDNNNNNRKVLDLFLKIKLFILINLLYFSYFIFQTITTKSLLL